MVDNVFYDGKSAKRHSVAVSLLGDRIIVRSSDKSILADWQIDDVAVLERDGSEGELWLTSSSDKAARLLINSSSMKTDIERSLPKRADRSAFKKRPWQKIAALIVITSLVGTSAYLIIPTLLYAIAGQVPHQMARGFAQMAKEQIEGAEETCQGPQGIHAFTDLRERLEEVIDIPTQSQITIAEMELANAIALPGGVIIIGEKLIAEMESPEELAAVLAHEMAHVSERHPTINLIRIIGFGFLLKMITGGDAEIAEAFGAVAGLLIGRSYSRDNEREADHIAISALSDAGINPTGLTQFFERLQENRQRRSDTSARSFMTWFSTHPSLSERIRNTDDRSAQTYKPAMSDSKWASIKAICDS